MEEIRQEIIELCESGNLSDVQVWEELESMHPDLDMTEGIYYDMIVDVMCGGDGTIY